MKKNLCTWFVGLLFVCCSVYAQKDSSLEQIIAQLQSKKASMRMEAVKALGTLKNKDAIPALTNVITDPKKNIRVAVVESLIAPCIVVKSSGMWNVDAQTKLAVSRKAGPTMVALRITNGPPL